MSDESLLTGSEGAQTHEKTPLPDGAQRFRLTLAYEGTGFHGWQQQVVGDGVGQPVRTVAGVVEDALRRVLRQPIKLVGASRTDADVHAHGQVAHFDAVSRIPLDRLAMAINSRLPEDVEALKAEIVPREFDAIRDARSKLYRYRIFNDPHRPLEKRRYVWHCWTALDIQAMGEAGRRLVGTHDFEGFAAMGHGRECTVRTIHRCDVCREGNEVWIEVEGNGFLYRMVRIIAGTLVEVGRGRFEPSVIDQVLAARDRRLAGPTLPGQGLCLEWIQYPPGSSPLEFSSP